MKSNITYRGLPEVPEFSGTLNYLYGLSDFWVYIFQDKQLLDKMLESQTYQLTMVYSKFLQLCSTISLFDIRSTSHSDLELILLDDTMRIDEQTNPFAARYRLPKRMLEARYLMDRPIFPKSVYEKDVHYRILEDGEVIEFYEELKTQNISGTTIPLSPFPSRKVIKNGVEVDQFAIWATDVEVDEQTLYNYFGKFVKVSPATSTDLYRDFLRGLYFLYSSGPTVELLKRGLNLAIGIPFARETEEVLDLIQDTETGNWNVITGNNSYTIPYGISPGFSSGFILQAGKELVAIADIWDYKTPGKEEWWLNIAIPRQLIPSWPTDEPLVASPGGVMDYYMRNFLKTHTFFVRIESVAVFNSDSMLEVINLIDRAKPTYTFPIYAWAVQLPEDLLNASDEEIVVLPTLTLGEMFLQGEFIKRSYAGTDAQRACGKWIHSNGDLTGYLGDVVVSTHENVATDLTATVFTTVDDDQLIPLYNVPQQELVSKLLAIGETPPQVLPEKFILSGLDGTDNSIYNTIVKRHSGATPGIGYNCGDVDPYIHEITRRYVPDISDLTANETLAFFRVSPGVYSVFLVRADVSLFLTDTGFSHIYFPPTEDETLTIDQISGLFDPNTEFVDTDIGNFWKVISGNVFQLSNGTVAAGLGDPVGYVERLRTYTGGLSTNYGSALIQSGSSKPILDSDGTHALHLTCNDAFDYLLTNSFTSVDGTASAWTMAGRVLMNYISNRGGFGEDDDPRNGACYQGGFQRWDYGVSNGAGQYGSYNMSNLDAAQWRTVIVTKTAGTAGVGVVSLYIDDPVTPVASFVLSSSNVHTITRYLFLTRSSGMRWYSGFYINKVVTNLPGLKQWLET